MCGSNSDIRKVNPSSTGTKNTVESVQEDTFRVSREH